jgi:competence protein ComEA
MLIRKILSVVLSLAAATCLAAADINKASQAELEAVKGIGPAMSGKILDERKKAPFKDWADVMERVKGVKQATASKFSSGGLTVNGNTFERAIGADKAGGTQVAAAAVAPAAEIKSEKKK